jgi:hypothetical protein
MKLLLFCLITPIVTISQINVSDLDLPSSNQQYYYSNILNSLSFDVSQTGANFNWDISALNYISQDAVNTESVNSTPIAYQFFFNNFILYPDYVASYAQLGQDISAMGTISISDRYDYYKITDSSFSVVGFGANVNGIPASVKYEDIDRIFPLPLVYGLSDSTSANYLTTIPSLGTYGQWINRKIEVDGWGQITTAYSSFDVIRLKTTLYQRDTVFVDQFGLGTSFDRPVSTIYEWYANGEGVPVLVVSTQAGIINEMKYLDQIHVSKSEKELVNFLAYPNPVTGHLFLELNLKSPASIIIYNIAGVVVDEMEYKHVLNLTHLKSGSYLIQVKSGKNIVTKKFIKL